MKEHTHIAQDRSQSENATYCVIPMKCHSEDNRMRWE